VSILHHYHLLYICITELFPCLFISITSELKAFIAKRNQNQTFHYTRHIPPKRVTTLRCPSPRQHNKGRRQKNFQARGVQRKKTEKIAKKDRNIALLTSSRGGRQRKKYRIITLISLYLLYLYHV